MKNSTLNKFLSIIECKIDKLSSHTEEYQKSSGFAVDLTLISFQIFDVYLL